MKKVYYIAIVTIFISIILIFGCTSTIQNNDNLDIDMSAWPEMPANTNPNFKYFGYYHFSESVSEVAAMNNANLAKVDAEDIGEIAQLYENDFNILIMIRHIFFESGETPDDYMDRWETAKEELAPYMDKVIGFYVDEPMWTDKKMSAFHLACLTVRHDFPDKRMFAMLMFGAVLNSQVLFQVDASEYCKYCTDIGYDFYRSWDYESVLADIELVKNNVAIYDQDIWLSPKGFYTTDPNKSVNYLFENPDLEPGEDIINWIKGSYEISVNDPRIVGFLTFCYGSDSSSENYDLYLKRFFDEEDEYYNEQLTKLYIQIGKAVIANDK